MGFNKSVNEARSKMEVAQSELDIYLSRHNTAVSQLSKAKETLITASETLKERKAAIGEINTKLPQTQQELKEVNFCFYISSKHFQPSYMCNFCFCLVVTLGFKVIGI